MTKTVFKVDGMMCAHCEAHVNDSVRNNFNVKSVKSSHKDGETVVLSEKPLDAEAVRTEIEKTGYKVLGFETSEEEKKGFFSKLKK